MSKIYKMKYDAQPGNFTAEELKEAKVGGCDNIIICSILENADGSASLAWLTRKGEDGGELEAKKVFNAWAALAQQLGQDEKLDKGRRHFCAAVFQNVQGVMKKLREEREAINGKLS